MTEAELQKQIVQWCHLKLRDGVIFWATLNERKVTARKMVELKRMGLLPGMADLIFLWCVDCRPQIFFVELKKATTYKKGIRKRHIIDNRAGKQSPVQEYFEESVLLAGADYRVIDNLDDFIRLAEKMRIVK